MIQNFQNDLLEGSHKSESNEWSDGKWRQADIDELWTFSPRELKIKRQLHTN